MTIKKKALAAALAFSMLGASLAAPLHTNTSYATSQALVEIDKIEEASNEELLEQLKELIINSEKFKESKEYKDYLKTLKEGQVNPYEEIIKNANEIELSEDEAKAREQLLDAIYTIKSAELEIATNLGDLKKIAAIMPKLLSPEEIYADENLDDSQKIELINAEFAYFLAMAKYNTLIESLKSSAKEDSKKGKKLTEEEYEENKKYIQNYINELILDFNRSLESIAHFTGEDEEVLDQAELSSTLFMAAMSSAPQVEEEEKTDQKTTVNKDKIQVLGPVADKENSGESTENTEGAEKELKKEDVVNSYNKLVDLIKEIKGVIDKKEDYQNFVVDNAWLNLESTYNSTKDTLDALKTNVQGLTEESSQEDLKNSKNAVEDLEKTLSEAYKPVKLKAELKEKVDQVKAAMEGKELTEDKSKAYKESLTAAEDLLNKPEADLASIETALTDLDKIYKELGGSTDDSQSSQTDDEKKQELLDKIRNLANAIDAGEVKNTDKYKKASLESQMAYDKAAQDVRAYANKISASDYIYNKEDAEKVLADYESAKENLKGDSFEDELKKSSEKLEKNKDNIHEKTYESLKKVIEEIKKDPNANLDTITDLNEKIDKAIDDNKGHLQETKGEEEKKTTKKVLVPSSDGGGKNKISKSIVRTGVDSIKIVAVILVAALIILVFTRKKKK